MQQVDEIPEPERRGRPPVHPYPEWFCGKFVVISEGVDYSGSTRKTIEAVRRYAARNNLDYVIAQRGRSIYIRPATEEK